MMAPGGAKRALGGTALLLAVLVSPLLGQEGAEVTNGQRAARGVIEGRVVDDATGEPVSFAVVLLSGTPLSTVAGSEGRFLLDRLSPGQYALRVAAVGYESLDHGPVRVTGGETARVELRLVSAPVELPGIVVSAQRHGMRAEEAPASVAVLSEEEIQDRSSITLDDALAFVPGVIFNHGQLDIRGATGLARGVGSRVLVLLNGHPVLAPASAGVNFDALPVLDVQRIEVIKGPHSAVYGSNALGGVVNVITRPIPREPRTMVKTHYGFYDIPSRFEFTDEFQSLEGVDVLHSRQIGEMGASLSVGRKTSDGFRENGDYSRWLVGSRLAFPAEASHPWEAYALWAREDKGQFFEWLSPERPLEVEEEELGDWLRNDKLKLGATLHPLASTSHTLEVRPYLNWNSVSNHFHDNQDFHRSTRIGSDLQFSTEAGEDHAVTLGGEAAWTGVTSNILGEPDLWDLALYAQDAIRLGSKVSGTAGLRLDYHSVEAGDSDFQPNPRLGIVFQPAEGLGLRASLSRGYRAPSAAEQFVSTTQFGFRVVPNPELEGESSWAAEVGVAGRPWPRVWLNAALFQSEYDGLIEPAAVPGELFAFQFRNVADARVRGLDMEARVTPVEELVAVKLTYTYLDTEDLGSGKPLPYRSEHNVASTFSFLGGLLELDYRYRTPVERVVAFPLDPRDPINLIDIRAAGRLAGLGLQLKVSNLLQHDYVDVQERNLGPSRRILLTVARTF